MMDFATLLISSLAIAASLASLVLQIYLSSKITTQKLLVNLLRESNQQNRSLTHLVVSRDFQTYAGLQSLNQQSPQLSQTRVPTYSTSDYIPRDDATEAMRIKAFGGAVGYGEALFDEDPELAEALSEMIANGQVDLGEGVIS